MQYRINDDDELCDLDEAVARIQDSIDESCFDDYLNDNEPDIEVCGITFSPADVLSQMDPTAYCDAFNDWADSEREYIRDELERLDDDEGTRIYGIDVEAVDDDEAGSALTWRVWYVNPGRPDLLEDVFDTEDAANSAAEALNTGFDRVDPMPEGARYEVRPAA